MGHYIGKQPAYGDYTVVDDFAPNFDGTTTTFPLVANGAPITVVGNPAQYLVVLGGILQKPGVDYTIVSGSIVFSEPPLAGVSCFVIELGAQVDMGVPSAGSVGPAQLDRAYIPEQLDGSRADGTYISSSDVAPAKNSFGIRSGSDDQCNEYFGWGPTRDRYISTGPNDLSKLFIYHGAKEGEISTLRTTGRWTLPPGPYEDLSRKVYRNVGFFGGTAYDYVVGLSLGQHKDPNNPPDHFRLFEYSAGNTSPNMLIGRITAFRVGGGAYSSYNIWDVSVIDGFAGLLARSTPVHSSGGPLQFVKATAADGKDYVYLNTGSFTTGSAFGWVFDGYVKISNGVNEFGNKEVAANLTNLVSINQYLPIARLNAKSLTSGGSYTLQPSDAGQVVHVTGSGDRTVVIPLDLTGENDTIITGHFCTILNYSGIGTASRANSLFITAEAGVTVHASGSKIVGTGPYVGNRLNAAGSVDLYKTGANTWQLVNKDSAREIYIESRKTTGNITITNDDLFSTINITDVYSATAMVNITIPEASATFTPTPGCWFMIRLSGWCNAQIQTTGATYFETSNDWTIPYGILTRIWYTDTNTWSSEQHGSPNTIFVSNPITASATVTRNSFYGFTRVNAAAAVNITIPPTTTYELGLPFNVGSGLWMEFFQQGNGQFTLVPGAGVTLLSANGLKSRAKNSVVRLLHISPANTWVVSGDTAV